MSSTAQPAFQDPTPPFTLFDSNSVGLATLIGGPVAGSFLMALNYRRLGLMDKAFVALVIGLIVTAVAVLIGWNLPASAKFPLALALLFATQRLARFLQGPAIQQHVEHGGRLASRWTAFASGLSFMAVLFCIAFVTVYKSGGAFAASNSVVIGTKDEVYYSGSATRGEAQALGNALKSKAYFTDRGADVLLAKGKDGTSLSFVVQKKFLSQPGIMLSFEEVAREVAPTVGGFPVQVRLVNNARESQFQSTVGKVAFPGNDDIYYVGTATQAQAQSLGKTLTSIGFFQGNGADVFLSKHDDGTVLSFVVGDGTWEKPATVAAFKKITQDAAPAVGGAPIKFRLVDTQLDVKTEETIQ
ncbi:MAG: hypothetical protein WA700_10710 [Acidobacteriaceae bacterium]